MANNSLRIDKSLSFQPQATAPADPRPGQLYVDSTDSNKLKQYIQNVGWVAIGDVQGAPVTEWEEYPLTIGATTTAPTKGTTVRDKAEWRRVGDTLEMRYDFEQSGAGTAGSGIYLFPLPPGLSADTAKLPLAGTNDKMPIVGMGWVSTSADVGSSGRLVSVVLQNATGLALYIDIAGTFGTINSGSGELSNANQTYSFYAAVPIAGWSSNVTMASDPSALPVTATVGLAANVTPSANGPIIYDTKIYDSNNAYSTSTGLYTVPVAGPYRVSANTSPNTGAPYISVYKNGSVYAYIRQGSGTDTIGGSTVVNCAVGDTLSINSELAVAFVGNTPGYINSASFERITGSTSIAIPNPPALIASNQVPTGTLNGSYNTIVFGTASTDTAAGYNTTTGEYTASEAGLYQVETTVTMSNASTSANNAVGVGVYVNGVLKGGNVIANAASILAYAINHSQLVSCAAGDIIEIKVRNDLTSAIYDTFADIASCLSIIKVSN